LAKSYYVAELYESDVIEKENDEYILHQLDFIFANYGSSKYKITVRENLNLIL